MALCLGGAGLRIQLKNLYAIALTGKGLKVDQNNGLEHGYGQKVGCNKGKGDAQNQDTFRRVPFFLIPQQPPQADTGKPILCTVRGQRQGLTDIMEPY